MTGENGNSTFSMQTPAAILAPKQQYLNLMMNSIYKFGELCAASENTKDIQAKISLLTSMIINYIPNPKERKRLIELRNQKRSEAAKIKDIDLQREKKFDIDCEIVGEIMTLMDDVLSIVERQTVISTTTSGPSALEAEYYPNGYQLPEEGEIDGLES
ncbi:hypothetical protein EQO05_00910 [Methanosarcina sp. MSH10X1]|uniref:hypothetical protein n=1 Tax=Methanosarcina sp. MSH10X1 TaxID=2507075 RepID=UPI000FFBC175|nr:hypothetical protein [Methanosarcina sp. MSH10X1]RXA21828.1 hypothetical protein EQO05_00910 [Methanosarcina sp. MSH10X1]